MLSQAKEPPYPADPPLDKRLVWFRRLDACRQNPGQWMLVARMSTPVSARSTKRGLESGRYRIPDGRFEYRYAVDEQGRGLIYARYLAVVDE